MKGLYQAQTMSAKYAVMKSLRNSTALAFALFRKLQDSPTFLHTVKHFIERTILDLHRSEGLQAQTGLPTSQTDSVAPA